MKPTSINARNGFPRTDFSYQSTTLGGYQGQCFKIVGPSFRDISRQYFQAEARCEFIGEAFFFAAVIITAVIPLLSAAHAVFELCCASGQL
jgi:hypothetical protein